MHHSLSRKSIERLFGVLFRQFRILYNRGRLKCVKNIHTMVKACCILHNIISGARGCEGTMQFTPKLEEHDDFGLNLKKVMSTECRVGQARQRNKEFQNFESATLQAEFTNVLISHICNRAGDNE